MSLLLYLFGSGLALQAGIGLMLAAAVMLLLVRRGWPASVATIVAIVGLAVIGLSAAPLSYWFYGFATTLSVAWLIAERSEQAALVRWRGALRCALLATWLGASALELPFLFLPRIQPAPGAPLYVVGDSVSAGTGGEAHVWPDLLPASVEVHNLSQPGATARSALKQCERLPAAGGIVLLEIGGNDLLGSTPAADFERDLDALLRRVAAPGRTVVMCELPLPPLMNEYGRIQRRLAARHGAVLIPKRVLMGVLAADGSTLDSIHLSPEGHQQLAAAVWQVLKPAYD